jgi:glucokinase
MVLAVDIGGTKIAAAVVTPDLDVEGLHVVPTPAREGPDAVLDAVVELLGTLHATDDARPAATSAHVAVCTAGAVDSEHGIVRAATSSLAAWAGTDVRAGLAERLLRRGIAARVSVLGDGQSHALGHWVLGGRTGSLLLFVVGTGVGGGYVDAGGSILRGDHGLGGHVGHVVVDGARGVPCPCGVEGHLEGVAAAGVFVDRYRALGGTAVVASAAEVVALARAGDQVAAAVLTRAGDALGQAAASLANVLDPARVLVSGGLVQAGAPWEVPLRMAYAAHLHPGARGTPLQVEDGGPAVALVGAAAFAEGDRRD